MTKYANYDILPDLKLILECCKGPTSVEDSISMKKDEISDNLYNPSYNIIVDIQEFETVLNSTTPDAIANFFNFIKGIELEGRIAFLTTKPHQVVLSEILKGLFRDFSSTEIEIFSTAEAAVRYLGYPVDKIELIKNKITALSQNTV